MGNERNILHKLISKIYPLIPFYEVVDLSYVRKCSSILANDVSKKYKPDVVIGIANGGLYPAFEISSQLGCLMDSMQISHYRSQIPVLHDVPGSVRIIKDFTLKNPKPIIITDTKSKNFEGKKALIVDDDSSTGDTLELAKNHLKRKNLQAIKTATIFKHCDYTPDFFVVENRNRCLIPPWRRSSPHYEDYLRKTAELGLF